MVAAGTRAIVMMVMLVVIVTAAALFIMMVVMLVVVVAAAALFLVVVMLVVMVVVHRLQGLHGLFQSGIAFHCLPELCAGELIPRRSNHGSFRIVLTQQCNGCVQLGCGNRIGTGENDGIGCLDLVVIELTEVLHIDLDLGSIHYGNRAAQLHFVIGDLLHSADDIGELADTGGLDEDPVGSILGDYLSQGLAKVAYQAAADTAGVHLGNIDAGILQEAAVNADLTEFVLDQHQLFALIALLDQLFDQCGLTGT